MKASAEFDFAGSSLVACLEIGSTDDAREAIEALKTCARQVWPEVVFLDEVEEEDGDEGEIADEAAAPPELGLTASGEPGRRAAIDFSKPPKPGSFDGGVLAFVRDGGEANVFAIADHFDVTNGVAGLSLARLRKGGHLEAL